MFFRLDVTQIVHKRFEYNLTDLLGDIAGIAELLFKLTAFVLGGFLSFNSSIEIMKDLYSHDEDIV